MKKRKIATLLCVVAAIIGCSSSDKKGEGGNGGEDAGGAGAGGIEAKGGSGGAKSGSSAGSTIAGHPGSSGGANGGASTNGGSDSQIGGAFAGGATSLGGAATGGATSVGGGRSTGGTASTVVWSWGQKGNEGALSDPDWLVDSVRGSNEGDTAAHPPTLVAATPVELTIDCGAHAHTALTFELAKFALAPTLELIVDGALRHQFRSNNGTWGFRKYVFDVPEGLHTYQFRASSPSDASTSFALDSITCTKATPTVASNGIVDFDDGFVPPQTTRGWFVDSVLDTYSDGATTEAEAAIHPPALSANTPIEMTFDCGQATHTELSFELAKFALAPRLDLLVDGVLRHRFASNDGTWGFRKYVFDVPAGKHSYTFRAQSATDSATSVAIDFLQCKNVSPVVATNGTVDFDDGFVPPEATGAWLVDSALGTYSDGSTTADEAAIHPPALLANTPVSMSFDCGQAAHTELSFYLAKSALAPQLELLVDGTLRYRFESNDGTWGFRKYVFDVPAGKHSYTFRAQSATDSASSVLIDFIQCKNIAPVVATNGTVDFDDGFVPPETTGGWLVDSVLGTYSDGSTTEDEAAIHPPALLANTPASMSFDCGNLDHSQLSFYASKLALTPTLDILVDGTVKQSLNTSGTWGFRKYTLTVASGKHTYTFRAQSTSDAITSFLVDYLQCIP